jgi:hypothetical protein
MPVAPKIRTLISLDRPYIAILYRHGPRIQAVLHDVYTAIIQGTWRRRNQVVAAARRNFAGGEIEKIGQSIRPTPRPARPLLRELRIFCAEASGTRGLASRNGRATSGFKPC